MNIPTSFTITTENLRLRVPSKADFPHIFSATRYEGFNEGMLWEPPQHMDELIEPYENGIKAWEAGEAYGFAIDLKKTEEFLGRISIRPTTEEYVLNVGFWTHPEYQGKGIMTEALAAVLDFGFNTLSAKRIEAAHATWNKASERVLQKNGMTFIKYLEHGFMKRGEWVEENVLAIDRETFNSFRPNSSGQFN